jgi:hypothetical protein
MRAITVDVSVFLALGGFQHSPYDDAFCNESSHHGNSDGFGRVKHLLA